jgi:sortase A
MSYIYKKSNTHNVRKIARFAGLGIASIGLLFGLYTLSPLISWQIYLKPAFASSNFASPIPQKTIMTEDTIQSLLTATAKSLSGNNQLMPSTYDHTQVTTNLSSYTLSIPQINIHNATVSTVDTDLNTHLVHFPGTALPPNKGSAVIFGHSTLPQLFNPTDYKTIFANAHTLKNDDILEVTVANTLYKYRIFSIMIVSPDNTSAYMTQENDNSYITIVTCTPPGTTWKRLIIKARLEKI